MLYKRLVFSSLRLHMLKVKGMSLKEVAAATDSNVNATKQMAHRAYVTLRAAAARAN